MMPKTLAVCLCTALTPTTARLLMPPGYSRDNPLGVAHVPEQEPEIIPDARIVGGSMVKTGKSWMVSFGYKRPDGYYNHYCGGSLIAKDWVLTAAHCIQPKYIKSDIVMMGGINLDRQSTFQSFQVAAYFVHPSYDRATMNHDIAVVRLTKPTASPFVAVNTPEFPENEEENDLVDVMGWGYLSQEKTSVNRDLYTVTVPVVGYQRCSQVYGPMAPGKICAGYDQGGKDACVGDSGGPLFTKTATGQEVQVGIVSYGVGCAIPGVYGVYTKVSQYTNWLRSVGAPITLPSPPTPGPSAIAPLLPQVSTPPATIIPANPTPTTTTTTNTATRLVSRTIAPTTTTTTTTTTIKKTPTPVAIAPLKNRWRPDNRCGLPQFNFPGGYQAQCNPSISVGKYCCSAAGFCGSGPTFCTGPGTIDFRVKSDPPTTKTWRDDKRCGKKYLLPNTTIPAGCNPDPAAKAYCCSVIGFCGATSMHCASGTDFRVKKK